MALAVTPQEISASVCAAESRALCGAYDSLGFQSCRRSLLFQAKWVSIDFHGWLISFSISGLDLTQAWFLTSWLWESLAPLRRPITNYAGRLFFFTQALSLPFLSTPGINVSVLAWLNTMRSLPPYPPSTSTLPLHWSPIVYRAYSTPWQERGQYESDVRTCQVKITFPSIRAIWRYVGAQLTVCLRLFISTFPSLRLMTESQVRRELQKLLGKTMKPFGV